MYRAVGYPNKNGVKLKSRSDFDKSVLTNVRCVPPITGMGFRFILVYISALVKRGCGRVISHGIVLPIFLPREYTMELSL